MKKKVIILATIIIAVCAGSLFYLSHKTSKNEKSSFRVKYAFADVDKDMVIQNEDIKDDDTTADYIFIAFTSEVDDNKKDDETNAFDIKSYKFDGRDLPKESKIYSNKQNNHEIIIKVPNGYLKGINAPHTLKLSEKILDKNKNKISGELDFKLPYSRSENNKVEGESKDRAKSNDEANNKTENKDKNNNNINDNKKDDAKKNNNKASVEQIPNYTLEIGKGVPFTTVVVVKLQTSNPENYKVIAEDVELKIRKNGKGENVFVGTIKKEYQLDQVEKLIKIQKIK